MNQNTKPSSFAPISGKLPRVLVLGSMPGQASLKAAQYYAHPRNAFWPIALSVINHQSPDYSTAHALPYEQRLKLATDYGIALWDVLAECTRPGSLDSNIARASEMANPIDRWLAQHHSVTRICFNGKTAADVFKRHLSQNVKKILPKDRLSYYTLPSTSPAMASLNLDAKTQAWKPALTLQF